MIGQYVIDAVLTESHDLEADVSEFPIEDGSTLTDHVRVKNKRYRMQGVVSDTPINDGFRTVENDGTELVLETSFAEQARVALEALLLARQPLRVVTAKCTYDSMVMDGLSFSDGAENGDALMFDASFVQIKIVVNRRQRVDIKFKAVDRGNQATKPPGWIGTDKNGRNIVGNKLGPGVAPVYTRADGTVVPPAEAAEAARKHGAVAVQYDKNGNAIPVDNADYQPYTPKQRKPFYAPTRGVPGKGG